MPVYEVLDIRNVAIVGHTAAGKTTLGEAMLFKAGATGRLGSVDDGTSLLDFDEESKERKHTLDTSLFHVEDQGKLLNVIDTPGMPDFCGVTLAALAAVETALIVVPATTGIGVNTRRMAKAAEEHGLARMVVISRMNAENANLEEVYASIKETFGPTCHAINLPTNGGKDVVDVLTETDGKADFKDVHDTHIHLVESIVETDEELMEAYIGGGTVPEDKLGPAIRRATAAGNLIPVLFVDAVDGVGVEDLMHAICTYAPSPSLGKQRELVVGEGDDAQRTAIEPKTDGPFIAQCFKVTSDPKSNIRYSVCRVLSGQNAGDGQLHVNHERKGARVGHPQKLQGAQHSDVEKASAGDIVAFAKLEAHLGDVVTADVLEGSIPMIKFPTPMYSLALAPKARGDVEKIGQALARFADEDPCFEYHRDPDTGELLMSGFGDMHLQAVQAKMKRQFKVEIETHQPKIPYRETISGSVKYVEYTHKKQSGGAGQFARVFIDMEPTERGAGYEFVDKIFGGVIDQQYRPAVDKGVQDQMRRGVIAGCQVVDVRVSLVDGKTHPVDSKDIAFQIAGRQVFKKAFAQCKPMLLEPVVNIEVTCPTDNMGDIQRDLAGKRGHIEGQDMLPGNQCMIHGKVPLAEVAGYASQLKSVTAGQGSYVIEFSHYDVVPPNVQQEIVKKYAAHATDDEE